MFSSLPLRFLSEKGKEKPAIAGYTKGVRRDGDNAEVTAERAGLNIAGLHRGT